MARGSNFSPAFWNHYETVEPRSNNHVEVHNFSLNVSICSEPTLNLNYL